MKKQMEKEQEKHAFKWEKGDFGRTVSFNFILPYPFLLLCRLLGITPRRLLLDFMDHLADSRSTKNCDCLSNPLVQYFLDNGYGKQWYNDDEIKMLFHEISSITNLWPEGGKMKMIKIHTRWRNNYLRYWYRKWYFKSRRK